MRRKDKAITNRKQMDAIIRGCLVCHLAVTKDNQPYLVPVSFGYDGKALYVHTATEGMKLDFFAANPRVCFEFERGVEVRSHPDLACKWSLAYESVIGFGVIGEVTEATQKQQALNHIMLQYSGSSWPIEETSLAKTRVWKIAIESLTGKRSQPKTE